MGRQLRPSQVFQTVTRELEAQLMAGHTVPKPPWYDVLASIPPAETTTRPVSTTFKHPDPKQRRPRNVYKPKRIAYPEDHLRRVFYQHHPWELARPRIIMELDGKDAQRFDWSKGLRQPGMPLCGESVVQRQLWLMGTGLRKNEAYDKARKEFYALRHEEDVQRRIAQEEAKYVGAYFGKSRLEVGLQLEDVEYEKWKKWASTEAMKMDRGPRPAATNAEEAQETAADDLAALAIETEGTGPSEEDAPELTPTP